MKKIYYSILTGVLCVFISLTSKSQVTVAGSTGANGTYPSLTLAGGAFAAINAAGTQAGNNITVSITADLLTETGANPLNASDWTTLTISPSGGAIRNVQGNVNGPLIDLNGADNVTIDGLNTGGNALNIDNQNGVSASTIRFINDASNNTLIRCNILGASGITAGPALGTIYFAGGTTTGNDNNAISQCILSASVTGTPQNAIYSLGTSAAVDNSNNTIFACLINDFFNPSNSSTGVNINSFNSGWLITTNVFYQTATRTSTATANIPSVIFITSGNGYTISNNIIGGSNTSGGGTPWTFNGAFSNRFVGINVASAVGAATTIQNNTITNLSISTTSGASTGNGIFCGISANGAGTFNIGNVTGNTIGATSGVGSITTTASTTAALTVGINVTCTGSTTLSNNSIGSITANGSAVTVSASITGIQITAGTPIVTNNVIGSTTTANSINSATVSTTGSQLINGINISAGVTVPTTITGNTIANLNQNGTTSGAVCRGIIYAGTGFATISNNIVRDISGATANTTLAGGATAVQGICYTGTSPAGATVSNNEIYTIRATNANAVATTALAIGYSNPSSGRIFKNRIYDIRNASTMTTATTPPVAAGIMLRAAPDFMEVSNNMISLGNAQTTNTEFIGIWNSFSTSATARIYYNTVRIEGTGASGALPTFAFLRGSNAVPSAIVTPVDIKNNIFDNSRTGGAGSFHYAIGNVNTVPATGWAAGASNNNVLNANASTIGFWTTAQTFAGWRTASASDALSISGVTVTYANTTTGDLHLNLGVTPTQIESGGVAIAGITDDYDNQTRPGPTGSVNGGATAPDMGADEFDGVPLDLFVPTITYTPINQVNPCASIAPSLSATITDASGINVTAGTKPRLYYKKSVDANTYAGNTNADNGWKYVEATNSSSPFSFTLNYALLQTAVATGDNIQYFVVAQDLATTPNVAINSGVFTLTPSSVALTAAAFPITGTINNYTITAPLATNVTIGAAGDYPSLTGAGGLFSFINNRGIGANVVANIIDASVTETGAVVLNQMGQDCGGPYTLTVKPNAPGTVLTGSLTSALIKINSSNVIIDGSSNGTTSRDLTITNTSTTTPSVILIGSTGVIPVINTTVKNTVIINGANTASAVIVSDGTTAGNPGYFNNITIQNNSIQRAYIGIFSTAIPLAGNGSGLLVTGNALSTTGANSIRLVGVYAQGIDGATISNNDIGNFANTLDASNITGVWLATGTVNTTVSGNTIYSISGTTGAPRGIVISSGNTNSGLNITGNLIRQISTSATPTTTGIFLLGSTGGVQIQKNNITDIKNTNAGGFGCNGIQLASTLTAANVNVNNNFISDVAALGFAGTTSADNGYGIIAETGGGYNIDFNSINMGTNQTDVTGLPSAINITSGITTAASVNIRNNIFANNQTTGTERYSIISTAANTVFGTIDYNDYYTTATNLGFIGSNRATLADIQTGFGGNVNSLNLLPVFVSPINLHLDSAVNCALNGKGIHIPTITTDIDNNTRDNPNPDMGADEFTSANLVALSGTPGVTTCESKTINPTGTLFVDASCNRIARVVPSGASPVSGVVNTCIYVETLPSPLPIYNAEPYLPVHYDVTPATNPLTSTGTITLYFLQSDFDNYNLNNGVWPDLPNLPGDAAGIANLRITQYHGSATPPGGWPANPSLPNQYSAGTNTYINPDDANIVWNVVNNYWEVTFNVTGFSGFYVHTNPSFPLPIVVNYLQGTKQGSSHNLNWKVTCASSSSATMVLERSADNRSFTAINTVTADALRCAQPFNYVDASPLAGVNYYRLRITDANGKVTYSNTIALVNKLSGVEIVGIAPNPVTSAGAATLNVASAQQGTLKIVVTDLAGRQLITQTEKIIAGSNQIPMNFAKLSGGSYQVTAITEDGKATSVRFVKQ